MEASVSSMDASGLAAAGVLSPALWPFCSVPSDSLLVAKGVWAEHRALIRILMDPQAVPSLESL